MSTPANSLNAPDPTRYGGGGPFKGFDVGVLFKIIGTAMDAATDKLKTMQKPDGTSISIPEMFDMQMIMNKLSQMSEMTTGVVSASHQALSSMARNVKG